VNGLVEEKNGLEEKFLKMCEVLITVSLNERNKDAVDMVKLQLIVICKKYCVSFAKLLEKADKMNQPNRLMLLRGIWEKAVLSMTN